MYDIREFRQYDVFRRKFLSNIPKNYNTPEMKDLCWKWQGPKKRGYGAINWGNVYYRAHRISCLIFKNILLTDEVVRHTCDNKACVNPKHLIIGNQSENTIDMIIRNPRKSIKLNPEAVKVIKWMLKYRNEKGLVKKLAVLYNVSPSTISHIKRNDEWSWITI